MNFTDLLQNAIAISETQSPEKTLLSDLMTQYPAFQKVYDPKTTDVVFADPQRSSMARGRKLEFWPAHEPGGMDFRHPRPGNTIVEVFDPSLRSSRPKLKQAVFGDLLHGMVNDPDFSNMRQEFVGNFSPQTLDFEKKRGFDMNDSRIDAYIRGFLAPDENDEFMNAYRSGFPVYSQKQLEILERMKAYLTGY